MKKTVKIDIRYSPEKLKVLTEKARKAGLSREEYCRRILDGSTVKEAPTADVHSLIREMRRAGCSVNEQLKRLNGTGFVDVPLLRQTLHDIQEACKTVVDSFSTKEKQKWQ